MAVPPGHVYTLAFGSLEILKLEDDNFEPLAGMDLPSGQLTGTNPDCKALWHCVHGISATMLYLDECCFWQWGAQFSQGLFTCPVTMEP